MRAILIGLMLSLGGAGCGDGGDSHACTLIGCAFDGLRIELAGASGGAPPPGTYAVTATAVTGGTRQCDFSLPGSGGQPACRFFDAGIIWSGFAPTTVTIVIAKDGLPVHDDEYTVTYSTSRPNGEGCDPVCRQGVVTIAIP